MPILDFSGHPLYRETILPREDCPPEELFKELRRLNGWDIPHGWRHRLATGQYPTDKTAHPFDLALEVK
jgi:hypothetical protein